MGAREQFTTPDGPAQHGAAITPHDTNELANVPRAVYVGGAGNLKVVLVGDGDTDFVTFTAVPAGTVLPIRPRIVHTDTTATALVALW
mgnify:CR=1 FL=1